MKRALISCLLAFGILFPAMIARADTVAMDYVGPYGNQSGGVYTFPYYFTLNGSGSYLLFCTTVTREITAGQQWNATSLGMENLNPTNVLGLEFPSVGVTGYLEVSYLFLEEQGAFNASNSDPEGLYNWAVWDLLSGQDASGAALSAGDEAQVQSYIGAAVALGNGDSLTPSQFTGVVIYTPIDMSESGPQEFLGYGTPITVVPEPSVLALVGFGVLGLVGVIRRCSGQGRQRSAISPERGSG